jgi:hypothetical protein
MHAGKAFCDAIEEDASTMRENQKCVVMQHVEDQFEPYQRLFFAHVASDKTVFEGLYKTLDMRLSLETVDDTEEECVAASGSCGAEHVSSSLTGVGCTYAFLQSTTFLAEISEQARDLIFKRFESITKVSYSPNSCRPTKHDRSRDFVHVTRHVTRGCKYASINDIVHFRKLTADRPLSSSQPLIWVVIPTVAKSP